MKPSTFRLASSLLALLPLSASAATYLWVPATGASLNESANWSPAPTLAPAREFTGLDTIQLAVDFATAPTFTLDGNLTVNTLVYNDTGATGDVGATIASGADPANTLNFEGTSPTITVTPALGAPGLTLSANLAGSSGITKNGQGSLTLSGDNSALFGTLTIADPGATNNGGVYLSSLASLGGITNVTTQGTFSGSAGTGGFFRIAGTAITIPSTVTFNLSGQGGNSAPNGALVAAGTGIQTVQGTINVNTGGVRISNAGATRFDIEGPILGGANGIAFRFAANEGLHLMNTSNAWTGTTINSDGILWFEPGCLPGSNVQLAASSNGFLQTKGTFTRALGSGAGQVLSTNVPGGARTGGFSARGGDLTVNLGGAGADVLFYKCVTTGGTRTAGSATITAVNTTNLEVGMNITGTGIPANATIAAIPTPGTSGTITISTGTGVTASTATLTCTLNNTGRLNMNTLGLNSASADSKATFVNPLDLNGFNRSVQVDGNIAELTGGVKNSSALAATLNKSGAGTLLLSVPAATSYSLSVGAGGGTLEVTSPGAIPTGATLSMVKTGTGTGSLKISTSGTNTYSNPFGNFASSNGLANGGRPNLLNAQGENTFTGNMTITSGGGNGVNLSSDAGSLTVSGNLVNNVTNSTRSFCLGGVGSGTVSGNVNNGTLAGAVTTVVKVGTGAWELTGLSSTFTGGVNLMEGVLNVASLADTGTASSIGSGGAIIFGGQGTVGTLRYAGATAQSTNHPVNILATGGIIESSGAGDLTLTGAVAAADMVASSLNYTAGGATATNTATLAPGVAVGMIVTATGLPADTTSTAINGNSYTLSNPFAGATAAVSTSFSTPARTLALTGSNSGANIVSGIIADSLSGGVLAIAKSGSGSWSLSGVNTHTGGTTVTAGALVVGNVSALGSGPVALDGGTLDLGGFALPASNAVTVAPGAALAGSGSVRIGGNFAGILAPGNSAGQITVTGDITLAPTAVLNLEIGGTAPGTFDTVLAQGMLTLAGTVNVSLINGFTPAAGNSFQLLSPEDGLAGTATLNLPSLPPGLTWNSLNFATTGIISVSGSDPLVSWKGENFTAGELANPLVSGDDADPDGDGLSNKLEFAFGSAPKATSAAFLPQSTTDTGKLVLSYLRKEGGVAGVAYSVQTNADLVSGGAGWNTATPVTDYDQTVTTVGAPAGFERVTVTFSTAVPTGQKRFGRVFVSF